MMDFEYDINGGDFSKAGFASSHLKKILKQINIQPKLIKRIVIAMYEAEVNIVAHAYEGKITVDIDSDKIVLSVKDKGPGIEDIDKAMEDGYSTASEEVREMGFGAGMGLSNIKNNADELEITSTVNEGTELRIVTKFR
jgi:anti-sigma regulatory factor (Ser/Thr protein kinase)